MITADTLAKRLDTLLGGDLDRQVIAEAVLQIIALDDDGVIVLPIAPINSLEDHLTIARIEPTGGVSPDFLAEPQAYDYIRNRFRGHP